MKWIRIRNTDCRKCTVADFSSNPVRNCISCKPWLVYGMVRNSWPSGSSLSFGPENPTPPPPLFNGNIWEYTMFFLHTTCYSSPKKKVPSVPSVPPVLVMATISKRSRNEDSILTSFSISKRNEPAYSRTCEANLAYSRTCEANLPYSTPYKDRSEANSVHSTNSKDRSGANYVNSTNWTDRSEAKSVYSTNSKERSGANSVYSINWKNRSEAKSVYSTNSKNRSGANSAYSRNRQDRSKKNNWIEVKGTEAVFLKLSWSPGGSNWFQGIDSASLCLGGPILARFLAPLDCSKAP
jgi:hypothetical protein